MSMRDYDDLVKCLRTCADLHGECALCAYLGNPCGCTPETPLVQAADAIEKLRGDNAALNGLAANLLEQIKDLNKPRWISVEDRLPEERVWVLCQCRAKNKDGFATARWRVVSRFASQLHERICHPLDASAGAAGSLPSRRKHAEGGSMRKQKLEPFHWFMYGFLTCRLLMFITEVLLK